MKKIIKVIASSLTVISLFAITPLKASAEWKQDSTGWWYTEGNSWATGWREINGQWYYFYSDGYMACNTTINGCVLDNSGAWITSNSSPVSSEEKAKELVTAYISNNNCSMPVKMNVVDVNDYYVIQCYYDDSSDFYAYTVEKSTGEVYSSKM